MTDQHPPSVEIPETPTRYAVSDIHGHPAEFLAALQLTGLTNSSGHWQAGATQLWALGDYFDRGPDGIGVIELLMRLSDEADAVGGSVHALLGNHEVLALGAKRFGNTAIATAQGERSFEASWLRNQGQKSDRDRLTERHLDWLYNRPALALVDNHLLIHSDIAGYLDWGNTPADVNQRVAKVLQTSDPAELWQLWSALTQRYQFRGQDGPATAKRLLTHFGAQRVMHGHSVIGEAEGREAPETSEPLIYCEGLVTAIDGGLHAGGPCLVVEF